jgi:cytochrome c-type biogenesis protein CcmH
MTMFWLFSGLAAALAGLMIMAAARRGTGLPVSDEGARQLAELEGLRARGLMEPDAFAVARAEAARRLLAEPTDADATPMAEPAWTRPALLFGVGAMAALALGVYVLVGSPGTPDQPYAGRVDEWATQLESLDPPRLAAVAARIASERPGDEEAQTFLGRARFEAGDPIGAATALRRALALNPTNAINWSRLGEALTVAQQGVVGADAEAAFVEALRLQPDNPGARYFLGRAALARGDVARARAMWAPLVADLPADDARRAALLAELEAVS